MIGLVAAAFGYGFRHGFDWDHVAAITDICASQRPRRRAFRLATLYALGHAAVVVVLGSLAIISGDFLPDSLDTAMGRVVGATLVVLGATVLWGLVRQGRQFRLRSRWLLVFSGIYRGVRHIRRMGRNRLLALDHSHEHEHAGGDPHDHSHTASDHTASDAASGTASIAPSVAASVDAPVHAPDPRPAGSLAGPPVPDDRARHHSHVHRHTQVVKDDPFASYGPFAATGVGMLHGVGVETPTQVLAFVLAAEVSGAGTSVTLLVAWVVGLFLANSVLTVAAVTGFVDAKRSFRLYAVIAVAIAAFSLVLGTSYLLGFELPLPS